MLKTVAAQFEEHDRRIFWVLFGVLGFCVAAYLYFLSVSVYAVVARKYAEQQTEKTNTRLSALESQYVDLDRNLNLSFAYTQGFVDVAVPRYVSREQAPRTLTLRQ